MANVVFKKGIKMVMVNNSKRGERLIFVGGVPRSGTTMVQNMLDSHPDIVGLPELKLLQFIMELRNKFHAYIDKEMLDSLYTHEEADENIRKFIENLINPFFDRFDCKMISEKTPMNVAVLSELLEIFPGARAIHVVRDPRAVISSLFTVGEKAILRGFKAPLHSRSIRAALNLTKTYLEAGFKASKNFPGRVLTVSYERVVTNPELETKRICQFLNISWSQQMLYPSQVQHIGEKPITCHQNSYWYNKEMFNRDPETKEIYKWKEKLSPADQIRITKAFKNMKELSNLGYDFSLKHLSPTDMMQGHILSNLRSRVGDVWLRTNKYKRKLTRT